MYFLFLTFGGFKPSGMQAGMNDNEIERNRHSMTEARKILN
jgi:hypothetical protein